MNETVKLKPAKKYEVCRRLGHGVVGTIYSNKTYEEATKICQSLNDETGDHIPQYFVRVQRRFK